MIQPNIYIYRLKDVAFSLVQTNFEFAAEHGKRQRCVSGAAGRSADYWEPA